MDIVNMKISDLIPYENNPRFNTAAVEVVAKSIEQCGYIAPIIVDEDMIILAGHTRHSALKTLGIEEAPVAVVKGLTEEQKVKFRLLDNKVGELAEWDYNKLAAEIEDLDFKGFDFQLEEVISPDDFDDLFTLPDGDKPEIVTMSFNLRAEQWWLIESALNLATPEIGETFGNTNEQGNALYTIVQQWLNTKEEPEV